MFDGLEKVFPRAKDWLTGLHIKKSEYHGSCLEGNECNKLLSNLDKLQALCKSRKDVETIKPFSESFRLFKEAMDECCKQHPNLVYIQSKIEDFKKSYLKTQLSITLKVHIFVSHFVQFLQGTGFDLSLASEQSHESLHHDFLREWNRCGMKDDARPNFGSTLLSCIVRYNSNHILYNKNRKRTKFKLNYILSINCLESRLYLNTR